MGCFHTVQANKAENSSENQKATRLTSSFCLAPGDFVKLNTAPIEDTYLFQGILGNGSFAEVRKALHKPSKSERAIKSVMLYSQSEESIEKLMKEVSILKRLDHPNIIRIFEVFRNNNNLYIVTELCTGGELFDRIKEFRKFSENQAAKYLSEAVSAVMHCHQQGVVHRDLKPENLLFESIRPDARLKLIDFGTSHLMEKNKKMKKIAGTFYYMAPEVIAGNYDEKCDVWSLGIILYIMLGGSPPFNGRTDAEIISKIQNAPVSFAHSNWSSVSDEAKGLIIRMLKKEPSARMSISEVFCDPWLQTRSSGKIEDRELEEDALIHLANFKTESRLQKAVCSYIVSQMLDSECFVKLREIFESIDKNGDGMLSAEELEEAAQKFNLKIDVQELIRQVDTDKNGFINYTEFLTATVYKSQAYSRERIKEVFDIFDVNHDGKISLAELKQALGGDNRSDTLFRKIIDEADTNGDGEIDLEEFIGHMNKYLDE